ncbi:MAG: SUMF1/EgtB/PvdO family nonheme iron enzyme [Alloprevotella sp.]|nr:SUMF1/EgtB/PvdO family nonheme iron enzyme [Alloprevotella sp.]
MFNSFSKSILFAPLLSLLLGGLVVSCGDDDNEEDAQTSSSNQNGGNNGGSNDSGSENEFPGKVYTVNGVSFKMIAVKGGTFQMGNDDGYYEWEYPVHQVTLSDYYIGETEVSQELWSAVMGCNPSNFTGNMQRPVETVSWNDCQTFISRLNQLTGETFRLPTEAQWEYAARGGNKSKGYTYSGSNAIDDVAWYNYNSDRMTHPVKTKSPNELGIYDMSGNVWEWCSDWFGAHSSDAQTDPTGPATGSYRVVRGGSWTSDCATGCRVADRGGFTPAITGGGLGLRLAY